ncbi:phosphoribosylformylglycinamidine cyclo-ligase [Myxococcota bacterium]|nr:phosphoribosylformylglycinamidine cyclo-ligase [Myxococcota bacterium]MBU1534948.1 phosphoribosylformylglycinamidine cyclo-ligase [Myxococcota bacterium]
MSKKLTYKASGVDIDSGNQLVDRIKKFPYRRDRPGAVSTVGGFSGLFALPGGYKQPVLVSGTDGVGTKLKLAFLMDKHDTIGWDLVAMSVNDVLVSGAKPLFFLDYYATSALDVEQAEKVVRGIFDACESCDTVLLGGETAELPGFYVKGEYDLAGFAVGIVERSKIPDLSRVSPGDLVIGLPSTGLHSNGFSLARKLFLEHMGLALDAPFPGTDLTTGEVLIAPTKIYVDPVLDCFDAGYVKSMVHVTGGGLVENPPRSMPGGLGVDIRRGSWPLPPVFSAIKSEDVDEMELMRTFNMGIGFIMIVSPEHLEPIAAMLLSKNEPFHVIGKVSTRESGDSTTRFI